MPDFTGDGKEQWKSLKTDLLEVAKARLREFASETKEHIEQQTALRVGKMTFGQAASSFLERLKSSGLGLQGKRASRKRNTESSIRYREETVRALLKSWPALAVTDVRKITAADCEQWSEGFSANYSATRFNNTLDSLRHIFAVAIKAGARHGNPAESVGRCEVRQKLLKLPERAQFQAFVGATASAGAWCSRDCADLVRLLAFTGCRKTEAANLLWSDVDFERGRIHLRITKNGRPRYVPMIPDARGLFERLRTNRDDMAEDAPVSKVHEAQKAMDNAAAKIGMSRITHHDLRHLFATQCIESGIDVPTVSRWLGHTDGGALAMKVYGHLRDAHSMEQAQKVSFAPSQKPTSNSSVPADAQTQRFAQKPKRATSSRPQRANSAKSWALSLADERIKNAAMHLSERGQAPEFRP